MMSWALRSILASIAFRVVMINCADICVLGALCRQQVFLMITVASVVTNAGLSVFTMQQWDHLSSTTRYWIFLGFQWTCFALQVSY
jgi:hypothetical protein